MKQGGCWIFLSHSSQDIQKVRLIRNEFEKHTHNPLAFHLRCLSDETPEKKKELDDLIKREIDCREWFVFCESPAAAQSDYVKMEKDYIRGQKKANVWTIDLSLPIDQIRMCVRAICGQLNVFISFAHGDGSSIYQPLSRALIEKDYDVWDSCGISHMDQLTETIPQAMEYGYAIVLLTESYVNSPQCMAELELLYHSNKLILPFYTDGARIPFLLMTQQCFPISRNPTVAEIGLIVELIDKLVEYRLGGTVHTKEELQNRIDALLRKLRHLGASDSVDIPAAEI